MTLDDLCHNVEPHAQAGDPLLPGTSGPIEPLKDFLLLLSRDAESMIVYTDRDCLFGGAQVNLDCLGIGRILERIAEQVDEVLILFTYPIPENEEAFLLGPQRGIVK